MAPATDEIPSIIRTSPPRTAAAGRRRSRAWLRSASERYRPRVREPPTAGRPERAARERRDAADVRIPDSRPVAVPPRPRSLQEEDRSSSRIVSSTWRSRASPRIGDPARQADAPVRRLRALRTEVRPHGSRRSPRTADRCGSMSQLRGDQPREDRGPAPASEARACTECGGPLSQLDLYEPHGFHTDFQPADFFEPDSRGSTTSAPGLAVVRDDQPAGQVGPVAVHSYSGREVFEFNDNGGRLYDLYRHRGTVLAPGHGRAGEAGPFGDLLDNPPDVQGAIASIRPTDVMVLELAQLDLPGGPRPLLLDGCPAARSAFWSFGELLRLAASDVLEIDALRSSSLDCSRGARSTASANVSSLRTASTTAPGTRRGWQPLIWSEPSTPPRRGLPGGGKPTGTASATPRVLTACGATTIDGCTRTWIGASPWIWLTSRRALVWFATVGGNVAQRWRTTCPQPSAWRQRSSLTYPQSDIPRLETRWSLATRSGRCSTSRGPQSRRPHCGPQPGVVCYPDPLTADRAPYAVARYLGHV